MLKKQLPKSLITDKGDGGALCINNVDHLNTFREKNYQKQRRVVILLRQSEAPCH